ncbi:uncharacterized protein LOC115966891 [Quercus lobata]|uniref:uncharacterized protein LOC115966891 n=1 Tax=Quercus lobata TaxID=97700 RepID=UPI0012486AC5|nr:uncharacterized protein LOC115966891 [Quercus lobata]
MSMQLDPFSVKYELTWPTYFDHVRCVFSLLAKRPPNTTIASHKSCQRGDNGVAYAWNLREQKWDKIGEVVDGPDDNLRRPVLDGIEYDYVFDVDIGDGEPIRKLPYNRSDNPYATADKWLLKENLPLSYRQQIVEFILQNSGQKDFTLDSSFRDPFTGSSAYIPGATSSMSAAVSAKPTFKHIPKILNAFSSCYSSPSKNLQLSYSTLILNYAVLLIEKKDQEDQSQVLSAALVIVEEEILEVDSEFHVLVAIGSLMLDGLVRKIALDLDVEDIAKAAKASKDAKIAEVGVDIELLTKQS